MRNWRKYRISIIVPVFNSEQSLEKCLTSIKSSHYKNFELIVINDASTDRSLNIALNYADKVINNKKNLGRTKSRFIGFKESTGDIVVNIDSDVIIYKNTLKLIVDHFNKHPDIDAITGKIAGHSLFNNFSSQYKNLYMNYYFSQLPDRVNFLYGSIFALRKDCLKELAEVPAFTDDTDIGQQLRQLNKNILLPQSLVVKHFKQYTIGTILINDYVVPFNWALIFFRYQGWKQLGRNQTGFAHASKGQIISLLLAPIFITSGILSIYNSNLYILTVLILTTWLVINTRFFLFLTNEKGGIFILQSIVFTFIDHNVMFLGVLGGTLHYFFSILKNAKPD